MSGSAASTLAPPAPALLASAFRRDAPREFAVIPSAEMSPERARDVGPLLERARGRGTVEVLGAGGIAAEGLHRYWAVLDHRGLHAGQEQQATHLEGLCAAGVPVVLEDVPPEVRMLLGERLPAVLERLSLDALDDPHARELASVQLRRFMLQRDPLRAGWPPPVSVVLVTRRADYLAHAARQIAKQSYEPCEVVVVLHGPRFDRRSEDLLRELAPQPCVVVRVEEELSLGAALNRGVEAASGEIVAKMDDDDWYDAEHLWELVHARDHSSAQLIAKASEFVYLAELDITIRRWSEGSERVQRSSTKCAGGTLLISKDDLDEVGGYRDVRRAVDQRLLEDVRAVGGSFYRAHGSGYVLNRHGIGHTWDPEVDYFLQRSEAQWRGLRLDVAGVA
jgi:hypothetical protein